MRSIIHKFETRFWRARVSLLASSPAMQRRARLPASMQWPRRGGSTARVVGSFGCARLELGGARVVLGVHYCVARMLYSGVRCCVLPCVKLLHALCTRVCGVQRKGCEKKCKVFDLGFPERKLVVFVFLAQ